MFFISHRGNTNGKSPKKTIDNLSDTYIIM